MTKKRVTRFVAYGSNRPDSLLGSLGLLDFLALLGSLWLLGSPDNTMAAGGVPTRFRFIFMEERIWYQCF
jgi:hypothetical protein